jgi:chromosome segregation ATPase
MVGLRRSLFGYSSSSVQAVLADREVMVERASRDAQSAEERAERLASELSAAARRLAEAEERLSTAQDVGEKLVSDLERSVEEREALQARLLARDEELRGANAALAAARGKIAATDTELRSALERASVLEAELADHRRQHDELGRQVANAEVWLRRAREESAGYKKSLAEEQARVAELEELLNTYRAELEERAAAPRADAGEKTEGPSSARELAAVLQVTEEAVVRIMESTRARAHEELRTIDRDRERIGREIDAMATWRDRAAPMISTLQATMDEVVGHANEIGVRVNEVLRPVTGAVTRLSSQLSSLDELSTRTRRPPYGPESGHEGARVIELRDDQAADRDT